MAGVLGAVAIVLAVTPLGFIPVPTAAANATIMHIPAIIGGVAEGPMVGLLVGFVFGLYSFIQAAIPLFKDPIVAILPRLLIGVAAYYAYALLRPAGTMVALVGAAVAGTATNTVLVLTLGVVRGYLAAGVAVGVGLTHGIPEIIVAALITVAVGMGLQRAGLLRTGAEKGRRVA